MHPTAAARSDGKNPVSDVDKSVARETDDRSAAASGLSRPYAIYTTFVMASVFMLAAADRNIMAILLVSIQQDLKVSDALMGALTGAAFSVVYVSAAFPLARLVDHGNRRNLLFFAVAFWSAMTAACGLAVSYLTLLLARMGVAVGESVHQPAVYSLVSDLYPKRRRGIAIACLTSGTAIGIALGAYVVGLLNDLHGWRTAFFVMGLPGIVVACLVIFTIPEPKRAGAQPGREADAAKSTLSGLRYLLGISTVRRLLVATTVRQIGSQSMLVWAPAFFVRVHGMTTSQMSVGFGLAVGVGSVLSALVAGLVTDRLATKGERNRAFYCAVALMAAVPCQLLMLFAPSHQVAFIGLFMTAIISGGALSVSLTLSLGVVRATKRGLMSAVIMFCTYVIGGGIGPFLLGGLNDVLKNVHGDNAIRYTLICVPMAYLCGSIAYYFAARRANEDSQAAELEGGR